MITLNNLFSTQSVGTSSKEEYSKEISQLGYFMPLQNVLQSAQVQNTHAELYLASGKTSITKEYTSAFNPTSTSL
jgi:hypothetical protein